MSFSKNTERLYCSHFVTFGSSRGIFSFTELFLMLQWTQLCCECTEDLCDLIKSNKKCLQNIMHKQILLLVSALLARIINVQSKTDSLAIDTTFFRRKKIFFRHTESLMDWVVSAEDDMDLSLISKLQCPPNQSYSSMLSVVVCCCGSSV